MCGICGIIGNPRPGEIERMNGLLRHRGPHDEGYCLIGEAVIDASGPETVRERRDLPRIENLAEEVESSRGVLGHRRLSILDIGPAGHQPMAYMGGRFRIVYNGEIYNFPPLREELEARGHRFISRCDTEVVLAAFAEWGPDSFRRLEGMFAFALHDSMRRKTFLVRDRYGIKPLYYLAEDGGILFASEEKSIRAVRGVEVEEEALYHFLCSGRVPGAPATFFREIRLLEPGHYIEWEHDTETEPPEPIRWYEPPVYPVSLSPPWRDYSGEFRRFGEVFSDAVHSHLISDVPVGFCLSGGPDSSAIVSVTAKGGFARDEMHTFSAVFPGEACDERSFIDTVVEDTGVTPHFTSPSPAGLAADLEELTRLHDEPITEPSVYIEWCVMRLVHEAGIRVVTSGHGADELLSGYGGAITLFLDQVEREYGPEARGEQAALFGAAKNPPVPCPGPPTGAIRILDDDFYRRHHGTGPPARAHDSLNALLHDQFFVLSLPRQLTWADKSSMAFSVECRVPFMDRAVVEYSFSMPGCFKNRDGWTKRPLREGLAGLLHERIRRRRSKFGYTIPEEGWFASMKGVLLDFIMGNRGKTDGILSTDNLPSAIEGSLTRDDRSRLFRAAAAAIFLEMVS